MFHVIYQTRETVFHRDISRHHAPRRELKIPARRSGFRGVWIANETLSRVFDLSSQSKQKLTSKRSLHSWQDFTHEYFCFGSEAVKASGETVRGLVKSRHKFPRG